MSMSTYLPGVKEEGGRMRDPVNEVEVSLTQNEIP